MERQSITIVISEGTDYADAVYEHTASATPFLRSTFRWNGNGWDLRFTDGGLFVFPENYSGTRSSQGAPVAMQDATGHRIQFERDQDRNLKRLVSPSGSAIAFEYDSAYRITQAADEQGHIVRDEYDIGGRLAAVSGGETRINYRYAGTLLANVATAAEKSLIGIRYDRGRVAQVDLADRRSYRFNFSFADRSNGPATAVVVMGSDGTMTRLDLTRAGQQ